MNLSKDLDTSPRELRFDFHGMSFSAQQWGDPEGMPVLALHGWLDNSATFSRLAPLLEGINLVALDMAGHGLSDHRLGVVPYNIWEDVGELFGIANQLGWDQFSLLGHSRGAIMSMLAAGTFPERIIKAALLDGLFPHALTPDQAPQQLAKSIVENQKARQLRVYSSVESMIDARQKGYFKLSRAAAQALTNRGVKSVDGGFTWSSDPHLMAASAVKLSEEQLQAFYGRSEAELLLVLADNESLADHQARVAFAKDLRIELVKGTHHFHLEDEAEILAPLLNDFFDNN